jgi:hypothetical protein
MQIKEEVAKCKCKPGGNAMMLYELNCKSFEVCAKTEGIYGSVWERI